MKHFHDLQLYNGKNMTGIAGGLEIAGEGTFISQIEGSNGQVDSIKIPCTFYVPSMKQPLLFPQHWEKTAKDNHPIEYGTKNEADNCNDNKQGKNEFIMIHLSTCPPYKLLQVPSNTKPLKPPSWHVMHNRFE